MQTWFECKVKYQKVDQGGHERKVNENYLIDAVSFTDAETRIYEKMNELVHGDFQVMNIRKSNITEVISEPSGEWWYKAKICMITVDEEAGKEKKISNFVLVMGDDIHEALKNLGKGLEYMLIDYVVPSIQLSSIADVFPYFEENGVQNKIDTNHPAAAPFLTQPAKEEPISIPDISMADEDPVDEEEDVDEEIEEEELDEDEDLEETQE